MIRFTLLHFGIGQEMRQQKSRNSHHDKKYTNSHNPSILIIQPFAYRIENCMPLLNRELTIKIINNLHDHLKNKRVERCGTSVEKIPTTCSPNANYLFPSRSFTASRTVAMSQAATLCSNLSLISAKQRLPILPSCV